MAEFEVSSSVSVTNEPTKKGDFFAVWSTLSSKLTNSSIVVLHRLLGLMGLARS